MPLTETSARLIKPVLRSPEKHQQGYNNILLPHDQAISDQKIADAAALLKLSGEHVRELMSQSVPMPAARTASREECELVTERLRNLGLQCLTVSDCDLGLSSSANPVRRVRSMTFDDVSLSIQQAGAAEHTNFQWAEVVLIVIGRLLETRLELTERMTRKTEN
ncbi:MAG TPA: hypothetical protein VFD75_19530, partial [Pyrinomonadaceae bacterium]|nr:hypothetical protein [Pyrinomonadaceae bacterium]